MRLPSANVPLLTLTVISITVTLKRFIIIFTECWIMGCSNALNENDLDIAAKFQWMAFNYQLSDVKVRPLFYCLLIYKRFFISC